ncbi:hypothetical protein PBRA_007175 [Plasmodiophora brassicae]|uniref:Uncharacterized protein n=1 Tax=Plasmodiophora brassicae TaxID=37360 RepID=A0A0G4IVC0_PLABS|nr:hypothetical protein PBRA_007175 [Plasmodiophora brassicae]
MATSMPGPAVPHLKALFPVSRLRHWNDNCVIIVSGASSGIGKQVALLYATRCCRLVLTARRQTQLEETARSCRALGSQAIAIPCDIADESQCRDLVAKVIESYGRIDTLVGTSLATVHTPCALTPLRAQVLCAGVGCHHVFRDNDSDEIYRRLMNVNFFGYLHLMRAAFKYLTQHQDGTRGLVVVVSALSGELGLPFRTALCASRFAVTGFFESLRSELDEKDNLDICIVCPPAVNTDFRKNSLKDESAHIELSRQSPEPEAISAFSCAQVIVDAADRRLRKVYFPLRNYIGVYMRPFCPDLVDKHIKRNAKL